MRVRGREGGINCGCGGGGSHACVLSLSLYSLGVRDAYRTLLAQWSVGFSKRALVP